MPSVPPEASSPTTIARKFLLALMHGSSGSLVNSPGVAFSPLPATSLLNQLCNCTSAILLLLGVTRVGLSFCPTADRSLWLPSLCAVTVLGFCLCRPPWRCHQLLFYIPWCCAVCPLVPTAPCLGKTSPHPACIFCRQGDCSLPLQSLGATLFSQRSGELYPPTGAVT